MPAQACESSGYREPIIRTRFNQVLGIIVSNYSAEEREEIGESSRQLHLNRSQLLLLKISIANIPFLAKEKMGISYVCFRLSLPGLKQYAALSAQNRQKPIPLNPLNPPESPPFHLAFGWPGDSEEDPPTRIMT
jgi:hypothetical protein